MLFRCNILALVGGGDRPKFHANKVLLWDDHQQKCIGELSFRSQVKAVRMRKEKVVVVLENRIYVYKFVDLKLVDAIDTCINTRGLVALNPETANEVLATPDKEVGHVRLTLYRKNKNHVIKAHENHISALALNPDGRLLATASEKGTLIRLLNTENGNPLAEFRRGSDKADIFGLTFDIKSVWLAVASDKSTIHVFAVTKDIHEQLGNADFDGVGGAEEVKDEPKNSKKFGVLSNIFSKNSYFNSIVSHMQFKLKENSAENIATCAFSEDSSTLIVVN